MASDSEILDAKAAIVSAALRLLEGYLGVIEAAREIERHRLDVGLPLEDHGLRTFFLIADDADCYGSLVEPWHPSVREQKLREIRELEESYRDDALRDAAILVERYGRPPDAEA
jgi:hypothetical protein